MMRKTTCIYYFICSLWDKERECRNCGLFKFKEKEKHEESGREGSSSDGSGLEQTVQDEWVQ